MVELEEEPKLDIRAGAITLTTHSNGDRIDIRQISLAVSQAAVLAWLVNQNEDTLLELQLRVKE